jgi:hypothetical protein
MALAALVCCVFSGVLSLLLDGAAAAAAVAAAAADAPAPAANVKRFVLLPDETLLLSDSVADRTMLGKSTGGGGGVIIIMLRLR